MRSSSDGSFLALALVGLYSLARLNRARAILVGIVYAANMLFALGYNVGDAHVFFLPSHLMIALLVAPGLTHLGRLAAAPGATVIVALIVAGVHVYRDYPALDRSGDTRPTELLDRLTEGLDDRNAVLVTDLNWQVQNGLTYYARKVRTDLSLRADAGDPAVRAGPVSGQPRHRARHRRERTCPRGAGRRLRTAVRVHT